MLMSHNEKPTNFCWREFQDVTTKDVILFDHVGLGQIFKDGPSTVRENEVNVASAFNIVETLKHSDFLYRNYILKFI